MPSTPFRYDSEYILSRVSIAEILSALGVPKLVRGRAKCPLHQGKNLMSFSVNIERGVWNCWSCGKHGGKIDIVAEMTGMSKSQAMKWIAELGGISLDEPVLESERREMESRRKAVETAKAVRSMRDEALGHLRAYRVLLESQLGRIDRYVYRVQQEHREERIPIPVAQEFWFRMNARLEKTLAAIARIERAEAPELLKIYQQRRHHKPVAASEQEVAMQEEYNRLLSESHERATGMLLKELRIANAERGALKELGLI